MWNRGILWRAGLGVITTALFASGASHADCVMGAKSKTAYRVLDAHTMILSGGFGPSILIKSFSFFHSNSQVTILKDSFCDFENAALYVDGEVVGVQQVKNL